MRLGVVALKLKLTLLVSGLAEARKRIAAANIPPLTMEEIEAEIAADRPKGAHDPPTESRPLYSSSKPHL